MMSEDRKIVVPEPLVKVDDLCDTGADRIVDRKEMEVPMNAYYLKKLQEELKNSGFSAILISPGEELKFLLGFEPLFCERFQGLFVKADGSCFYVCNLLYEEEFKQALPPEIRIYSWFDGDVMTEVVEQVLEKEGLLGTVIGVNSTAQICNALEIMEHTDVTFKNGKPLLEKMRVHKNSEELQALRESSAVVDRVFEEVLPMIKPGVTEKEIGDFLLKRMTELGGGCAECIVGVGPNSAYPHYNDNKGVIREHDIVLMDYGCTIRGMYSDMTRTVFFFFFDEKEREVYGLGRGSSEAVVEFVREDAVIPDIDRRAREILDEKGYAWSLVNRLGHGVGYTIHEAPDIKRSNPVHLERGMAFTIEPGIYLAGAFGVRVEDMVVINEKGEREILNHATKDLIVL